MPTKNDETITPKESKTVKSKTPKTKKSTTKTPAAPKKKRKKNFVNNADLLEETIKSQEQDRMTEKLGAMLMTLCERYKASSRGNFTRYTYFDEMKSEALENLVKNGWRKFDTQRGDPPNPFAFFTSCVHNSYLKILKYQKKHRDIRDKLLIEHGMEASYRYMEDHSSGKNTDSEYSSDSLEDDNSADTSENLYD